MGTGCGAGRVLIVEDDRSLRYVLHELFDRDGFDARTCGTGAEVAPLLSSFRPDVLLLDLGLPDVNGFDLLREVRATNELPVIVLSGREAESDRVTALELGADDYVVKPFLSRELVARVRVRLRRPGSGVGSGVLGDDGLVIDPASREVHLAGVPVALTPKEFDVLAHLAGSPRRVFSREQLLDAVWASTSEWQTDTTVTEHVHRLRQKVGAERIVTVRGAGYRFDPV